MPIKNLGAIENNTLLGILAILFWGSTIAFSRSLTEQLGTITAGGLVFSLSALFAWIYSLKCSFHSLKKMIHLSSKYLWGCGIFFITYMAALYLAIGLSNSRQQAVEISIINYLWPGLTLLFSIPILKNRARLLIIPGIMLGFIGVYIAMNPYHSFSFGPFIQNMSNNSLPYIFAFIAAISWAFYSIFARKWATEGEEGAVPVFLLLTGLMLLTLRLFFQEESIWSIRTVIELLYMAIFPTFLAYSFWDQAMRRGNILFVVSISYFTPILSVFISSIYLQISIDIQLWIAAFLVATGAFISKISIREK